MLPPALRTGKLTIVANAMAREVTTSDEGLATGVSYVHTEELTEHHVRARVIVLAASCGESARLLLNSPTAREPNGLGNNHDQVGRNLQGHVYPVAYGLFDEAVHGSRGPGVGLATTAWNHGNPGIVGGGMLADDFVQPPAIFWKNVLPPDQQRWGLPAKDFMRERYHRVLRIAGPVHEIPNPTARVTVSGSPMTPRSGSNRSARSASPRTKRSQPGGRNWPAPPLRSRSFRPGASRDAR